MASLRNLFSKERNITEKAGNILKYAPVPGAALLRKDFNVSERLGSLLGKNANASSGVSESQLYQNIGSPNEVAAGFGNQPEKGTVAGAVDNKSGIPRNPADIVPANTGGPAPSGGNNLSEGENTDGGNYYDEEAARNKQETQDTLDRLNSRAREAFNTVIGGFDTRLSELPGNQALLEGKIESGSEARRGLVNEQLSGLLNTLSGQEDTTRQNTQRSLRDLAEDQRNTTTSLARQLGARGAGDTSAGDYASAAIGRQGLKQRGQALEQQKSLLGEIDNRRFQTQNIANQEIQRIEADKQDRLFNLTKEFQTIKQQLQDARNNASFEELQTINEYDAQLSSDLQSRLQDLNDQQNSQKQAIEQWNREQEAKYAQAQQRLSQAGSFDLDPGLQRLAQYAELTGGTVSPAAIQRYDEKFSPTDITFSEEEDEKDPLGLGSLDEQPQQGFINDDIPLLGRF